MQAAGAAHGAIFQFGDITVDMNLRSVHKGATVVHLTPIEYRLLGLLVSNAGKVLTHRQILRDVWGPSHAEDGHYVRVYMGHLRHKLEDDPTQPKHIVTETAVGYRLVQQPIKTLALCGVARARGPERYPHPTPRKAASSASGAVRQPPHQAAQPLICLLALGLPLTQHARVQPARQDEWRGGSRRNPVRHHPAPCAAPTSDQACDVLAS